MRGDRMAKRSSFGNTIRKRLSDITNYQPQPKSPPLFDPHSASSSSITDYIHHLSKENAELVKLITDKNKVIEMIGVELQKVRLITQKTQLQNWNIAQSNSHMLAELNLVKQKMKALQHQLACKDATLKTLNLELKAQIQINDQKCGSQGGDDADTKHQNPNRRMRPIRSQSVGPTMVQQVSEKEASENKRRRVRRQSAGFRSQGHEPEENLFEIEDLMHEAGPISNAIEQMDGKCSSKPEPQASERMSIGRPSRRASLKIQSYKEIPLNVKMRRPE